MRHLRVVIGNMPELLLQIVARAIRSQPDLELVYEARGNIELLQAVDETVELVVVGADQVAPCPGICSHLLSEHLQLKILVLSNRGDEARGYWMGLRQRRASVVSMTALLRDMRRLHQIDMWE